MHLPMQSQPVQRTLGSQPFAHRGDGPSSHQGIAPSQYGIQASGWFNDALDVIKTVGQTAGTLGPALGAIAGI